MYILSIESSTKIFALALSRDDRVLRYRNLKANKVLENSIIPAIDRILSSAHIPFEKLDAFAIGLGPGSFTSLRVGLSTVKAFAMATHKPVVGVCSLDVIAETVKQMDCDEICVIVDARRNLLYSALYQKTRDGLKRKGDYQLTDLKTVLGQVRGRTLFVGDGAGMYRKEIEQSYEKYTGKSLSFPNVLIGNPGMRQKAGPPIKTFGGDNVGRGSVCTPLFAPEKFWFPQAVHLAKLGFKRLARGNGDDAGKLVPIYLYPHDCQVSRNAE